MWSTHAYQKICEEHYSLFGCKSTYSVDQESQKWSGSSSIYQAKCSSTDQNVQLHIGDHKVHIIVFYFRKYLINDQEAKKWSGYTDLNVHAWRTGEYTNQNVKYSEEIISFR